MRCVRAHAAGTHDAVSVEGRVTRPRHCNLVERVTPTSMYQCTRCGWTTWGSYGPLGELRRAGAAHVIDFTINIDYETGNVEGFEALIHAPLCGSKS
jgi:hypothetical protein